MSGRPNNNRSSNGRSSTAADDSIRWRALASLDMYRKVPVDLMEGSAEGRIISWITIVIIGLLFVMETASFLRPGIATDLALDNSTQSVEVRFNITMMDLKCDYATIDVVSVLGKEQNVTKSLRKWTVDADGVQGQYMKRNLQQHDIDIELHDTKVTQSLEELHKNGVDAIPLEGKEKLELALKEYDFVFVDYYAMWCSHCRQLMPTWEKFAEIMYDAKQHDDAKKEAHMKHQDYTMEEYEQAAHATDQYSQNSILIAKVDCVKYSQLCREQFITSYPTLRLFIDGKRYIGGDFHGHRTVYSFVQYLLLAEEQHRQKKQQFESNLKQHAEKAMTVVSENMTDDEKQSMDQFGKVRHDERLLWNPEEHPGCQIAGRLQLQKAPSHFYIQAQSKAHDFVPSMTNVSHEIHHLSFHARNSWQKIQEEEFKGIPPVTYMLPSKIKEKNVLKPMDGNVYVTHNYHEAYHHYIKIVSTNNKYFQMIQNSQLMMYPSDKETPQDNAKVPEAKFIIDLSPIAVRYRAIRGNNRTWYDYITSLMAIIGGTFTVVGIIESAIRLMNEQRIRKSRKKQFIQQRQQQQVLEQEELVQREEQQRQLQQLQQEQQLFQNDQHVQQQHIHQRK